MKTRHRMTVIIFNFLSIMMLISLFGSAGLRAAPGDLIPELPASGEATGTNSPVWDGYKPPAQPAPATKPQPKPEPRANTGFTPPPPSTTPAPKPAKPTKATIIPSTSTINQGDSLYFRLQKEYPDAHYYWITEGQKSTDRSFKVDTTNLSPGKHRVRVSVTKKSKEQVHGSLYYEVQKKEGAETAEENQPPVDAQGNVLEDENGRPVTEQKPVSPPEAKPETPSPSTETSTATTATKASLINPATISINKGQTAHFKVDAKAATDHELRWRFDTQLGDMEHFQVTTQDINPGTYQVHLKVIANDGKAQNTTATLIVKDPDTKTTKVPNLLGKSQSEVETLLKEAELTQGSVSKKQVDENPGQVLEQSPAAGTEVNINNTIDIVIGEGATETVPNVTGKTIDEARTALKALTLNVGIIEQQESDQEAGTILSQQPTADSRLAQGGRINLVVAIKAEQSEAAAAPPTDTGSNEETATPTPTATVDDVDELDISINPTRSSIEQGDEVQFTAAIATPESGVNYQYNWSFGPQKSDSNTFTVTTKDLALGKHAIKLNVKDSKGKTASIESILEVKAKIISVPAVTHMTLEDARKALKKVGLQLGTVEKIQGNVLQEVISKQTPEAGKQVSAEQRVDLEVLIPKQEQNKARIKITFDKASAKAGEPIVFKTSITPETDLADVHYVYQINGKKTANINPEFSWTPEEEDTYTVSVTAYNDAGVLAKSEPYILDVAAGWEKPIAKVLPATMEVPRGEMVAFSSNSTYDLNSTLKYEWISSSGHSGDKRAFVFDSAEVNPGSYDVTLTVTDDKDNLSTATVNLLITGDSAAATNMNVGTSASTGGTAAEILSHQGIGETSPEILIKTSSRLVKAGQNVQFNMQITPDVTDVLYFYELGDKTISQGLTTPTYEHKYKSFGSYSARAAIKQGEKVYLSKPVTIWVWSPGLFMLIGGLGALLLGLIWWWTKRGIRSHDTSNSNRYGSVKENQVPLPQGRHDKNDIVTDKREERTVKSVLIKGLLQFIMGIILSLILLYLFLKLIGLV